MSETPLYDELEAKWNAVGEDRRICDEYTRCFYIESGAEWYEDDEGNEVFLLPTQTDLNEGVDLTDYLVPDPPLSNARRLVEGLPVTETSAKRKRKLFGRNQGTNGTL